MENLLLENRAHGWADASSAPPQIQARIIEIRSAILADRPVPAPSRYYIEAAERRNLTLPRAVERKLFPTPVLPSLAALRAKARKQAADIERDHEARRVTEEQILEFRREVFPWEFNS